MARLGVKTGFIGKVATDREGSLLHNNLQNENVNTKGVMLSDNGRSGTVSGFVDGKGQRALYVDPGVNDCVEEEEIDMDYINNTEVLHLTSFVGKYDEKSIKSQKNVLDELSTEVSMSFDPGRLYTDRGIQFLDKFLMRTDILLINRSELKHLLTGKIENSRSNNENSKQETVKTAGKIQEEYGIDIVVVKLGDQGSYVTRNGESIFTKAFKVSCVDTTGAGDAFNAGFINGYINGENIESCAIKGNYVASRCVTEHGATDGLPDIIKMS